MSLLVPVDRGPRIVTKDTFKRGDASEPFLIWNGDVVDLLGSLPARTKFDLIVTSPPYNIGKSYETRQSLSAYLRWQRRIIKLLVERLSETGSLCWQVGNYVEGGEIFPLDLEFAPIFKKCGLRLRNRIIWHFGHGLHSKKRFSGRYEVILWYTKGDNYHFDLDAVRTPAKYPGKKHYKGPKAGQLSGNPKGKNPEDVWSFATDDPRDFPTVIWEIPNVKSNHVEKTSHPCQFPVALVERLTKALTKPGELVFDPFAGVCTAGVSAALFNRRFLGAEINPAYAMLGAERIADALAGRNMYRPADKPLYDHTQSTLSKIPDEWLTHQPKKAIT
jgi:adenine-specific DNA-methyltransferase